MVRPLDNEQSYSQHPGQSSIKALAQRHAYTLVRQKETKEAALTRRIIIAVNTRLIAPFTRTVGFVPTLVSSCLLRLRQRHLGAGMDTVRRIRVRCAPMRGTLRASGCVLLLHLDCPSCTLVEFQDTTLFLHTTPDQSY